MCRQFFLMVKDDKQPMQAWIAAQGLPDSYSVGDSYGPIDMTYSTWILFT
jgi:hypothetical protein